MYYEKLLQGIKRFGSTEEDILAKALKVSSEDIKENVVIAPWWEPDIFPALGEAILLNKDYFGDTKVWNIKNQYIEISYIKTGCGAPALLEGLLPLGLTKCKRIIFIGSVGSLHSEIGIGDIIIPKYSVCGDGVSRYLSSDDLSKDPFGEKVYPDFELFNKVKKETIHVCKENGVKYHIGQTFSVDTIFAQFAHLDTIIKMGCNSIEMETAAAFRAAKIMNIPLMAVFSVSDNAIRKKSLVSGRTEEEKEYRKYVRREIFPKIILRIFSADIG